MPFELPSSLASLLSLFGPCVTQPTSELLRACGWPVDEGSGAHGHRHAPGRRRCGEVASLARAPVFARTLVGRPARPLRTQLIVAGFVKVDGRLAIAIDDTLFKRFGPRVLGRRLNYDGCSQSGGPKSMRPGGTVGWRPA